MAAPTPFSAPLRYALPMAGLAAVGVAFLLPRLRRPPGPRTAWLLRVLAAAPLVASGTLHLVHPQVFVALLPPPFPPSRALIVGTGVAELLGAAGLFVPPVRRAAAGALAVFLVAIFPANVYVAGRTVSGLPMPGVPVRTAMQAVYMLLILACGWGWPIGWRRPQE